MTRFTDDQIDALRDLRREVNGNSAYVTDTTHGAIAVTIWRDDSETPACTATISSAGTVRVDLAEAA